MERKTSKRGPAFLVIGLCLLIIALDLYVYNVLEDNNAGKEAHEILNKMGELQPEQNEDSKAPTITIEGDAFCGKVLIDKIGVELPVFWEWDYTKLKKAPCRYSGSVDESDMIIAAHNYTSHFGNLKNLEIGDEIAFIDAYGETHRFAVKELIFLDGTAVSDMKAGEWDFTLFTCTKGGKQRVTVRCDAVFD